MMNWLKKRYNLTFDKNIIKYIGLYNSLNELNSHLYELVNQKDLVKADCDNKLNFNPELEEQINKRYNNYYSFYLDKLVVLRKKRDYLEKGLSGIRLHLSDEKNNLLNEIIKEKQENFVYKKYMKSNLGYKRENLPQIDKENFNSFLTLIGGELIVSNSLMSIKDIKPTQTKLDEEKIIDICENKIPGESKGFEYIISKDNHLLDGHHNWAADLEDDENKKVKILQIDKPIEYLIKRGNELKILKKAPIEKNIKTIVIDNEEFEKACIVISTMIKENDLKGEKIENLKGEILDFTKYIQLGEKEAEYKTVWQKMVENNIEY